MNNDKICLFGPYIGDWKEEIVSFRPFVKWIHENIEFSDFYLSSHINRRFLYPFIKDNHFLPVYEKLSREEIKQNNCVHSDIDIKEYNYIVLKKIKEQICSLTNAFKKDIIQYSLSYIKAIPTLSIDNKNFSPISFNKQKEKKIVFIPDFSESESLLKIILDHLEKNYPDQFVIVGDDKTFFNDKNIVKQRIDYFEVGYQLIVDWISNASLVICPCSHWTVIANQQSVPVFSWGHENINPYKTNGFYGFDNKNIIVEINSDLIEKRILNSVDFAIKNFI